MKEVACAVCGAAYRFAPGEVPTAGTTVTCGKCKARIVVPAPTAGGAGDVIDLADLPAPRRPTGAPTSRVSAVDLPAPKGPRPTPVVDLPAPKATARPTAPRPREPEPFTLDGVDLVAPAAVAPPSPPAAKATLGPHTNLPAPRVAVVDLPAPKGPSGPVVDLPAPKGASGPVVDLPAPKGKPAADLFADLPAPRAPISDLPAPKGPPAMPNLPAPKRAAGDGPRPPVPMPSVPKVPAQTVAGMPPPRTPAPSAIDLPPPARAAAPTVDLPSPGRAAAPTIDLPAPKGFFDDLPGPTTTKAPAGGDLAPKGFFDDLPSPAMTKAPTLDLPAPKGFFDDLPGPATAAPAGGEVAPKGFFDDLSGPQTAKPIDLPAPKGFFDDLPAEPSAPPSTRARATTSEALSLFDDLGPPTADRADRADRFAASAPTSGALDGIELPVGTGMSGLLELEPATASARAAPVMTNATPMPTSTRVPASDTAPPLELDADPLGLELPTASPAPARGGVSFKSSPGGGGSAASASSSAANADSPELDLALDRRRDKAEAPKAKRVPKPAADDGKRKLSPRATRFAIAAALGLAAVGAGGFVMYRRWDAQKTRAASIDRSLATARKAVAANDRGHWRRAVRAAGDVLALDKKHREALAISAQASLAAYLEEGTEGTQRSNAAKRFFAAIAPGGERLPALIKAEALRDVIEGDLVGAVGALTPLAPSDPDAQLYLGWAHAAAGQWPEAIAAYNAALTARPAPAYFGLAQAQAATGADADAHASYLKVIELDPDHVAAQVGEVLTAPGADGGKRETSLLAILQRKDIDKADPRAVALAWIRAGDEARRAGRLDAARERYRKALAIRDKDPDALVSLAATELADDKLDAAADAIAQALAIAPDHIEGNLTAAEVELGREQLDEAAARLSKLRDRQPPIARPSLRGRLEMIDGRRLEAARNPEAALAAYERAEASASAGDIAPVIAAATLLGRMAEAATADAARAAELRAKADAKLGQVADAASADPAVAIQLGTAYLSAGAPIQAERWLRGAIEQRPGDVDAHYQLAEALRRQGKQDAAVATLVKAFELDPSRTDLGGELARGFEAAGRDADAADLYKRLLAGGEVSLETKMRAGRFFARTGDVAAARAIGDELLTATPDDPTGNFLKAEGLLADRRYAEARRIMQEVANSAPDPQFLDGLGRACEAFAAQGNDTAVRDEALRAYEQVVKLAPDVVNAWVGIGRIRLARGEYEKALTAYERALKLAPGNAEVPYGMGKAYVELDDRRNAITWLSRAVVVQPSATAYWELGKLYYESDRASQAASALDRATALATKDERDTGLVVPWLTDALWLLGTVQQVVRNDGATIRAWEAYLDRKPQNQAQVEEVRRFLRARGR